MGSRLSTLIGFFLLGMFCLPGCAGETAVPTPPPSTAQAASPDRSTTTLELAAPTPTLHPAVTPLPPPTPPITPSPNPSIEQSDLIELATVEPQSVEGHLAAAQTAVYHGDYRAAINQYYAVLNYGEDVAPEQLLAALYGAGDAYRREGSSGDAATVLNQLVSFESAPAPSEAHFLLGEANTALGEYQAAIDAYQTYVQANPDMAAYVYPRIAPNYLALDDQETAVAAYTSALESPAHRLTEVENRQMLANFALEAGDFEAAIAQYDAIYDVAQTEATRGAMTYLAGAALQQSGDTEAAFERFQYGLENYPGAYETYLGLVELIKAEESVDEYQRGLVDFEAAAFQPAIEAFERLLESEEVPPEAHLYLAWSHEALGDLEAALAAVETYVQLEPERGALERAKLLGRSGESETAVTAYLEFLETYPKSEEAPFAAWWAAVLTAQLGDGETAVTRYTQLADDFPDSDYAPQALYNAGWLAFDAEDQEAAFTLWQRAAQNYPEHEQGAAALVWLMLLQPVDGPIAEDDLIELGAQITTNGYYGWRARDLAAGNLPFRARNPFVLPDEKTRAAAQEEAELWLREWLQLDKETAVSDLSPELQTDDRRIVGEKLWQLGLYSEAIRELEGLRAAYADDPLATYQLALYLRDLGAYRSSIGAAESLLAQAETSIREAPQFIGQLAYPIHYAELILPLAAEYGFDPRLQFALVRQESLFESVARSGAAAQGLSQVIPDTGAWIANRLAWPDYENEDLYKPYVGLTFGAYYLDQQLQAFDEQVHVALSAYNGGPGNAARWFEAAGSDLDAYVTTVDFPETRLYIERIYTGYDLYRDLYR